MKTTTTNGRFISKEEIDEWCIQNKCKDYKVVHAKGKELDFCKKYDTWCFNTIISCQDVNSLKKEPTATQKKLGEY